MTNYKVMVQAQVGVSYDLADSRYEIEREALDPIGAEIVEVPAKDEAEFIAAVRGEADALIGARAGALAATSSRAWRSVR